MLHALSILRKMLGIGLKGSQQAACKAISRLLRQD
jgi:hypothetical protein